MNLPRNKKHNNKKAKAEDESPKPRSQTSTPADKQDRAKRYIVPSTSSDNRSRRARVQQSSLAS